MNRSPTQSGQEPSGTGDRAVDAQMDWPALRCARRLRKSVVVAFLACCPALALVPLDALSADGSRIDLVPGDSKQLTFSQDVDLVVVTDPDVADIDILGIREIVLIAKTTGVTELTVRAKDGTTLLSARIRVVDTTPDPVTEIIRDVAGPDADIRVVSRGETLFVSGRTASPVEAARVLRAIRAVVPDVEVVDDLVLGRAPQINLEVLISEVSRNVSNSLGVDWTIARRNARTPIRVAFANGALVTDALTRTEGGPAVIAQEAAVFNAERTFRWGNSTVEVDGFLEALAGSGLGVVHAKPNLTTVSGGNGRLLCRAGNSRSDGVGDGQRHHGV